ncbi:GntR family transcriptional regulator [Pseudomonas sp. 5P_3.1_Bac2]|uniref:GntR family transcriptional regulator n=1 Tax=Pseudomonas sp. 5P_3.1_Bac2 TaxID=2971617 RepID=UPI0021C9FE66|nr:GntR family transcriptional regulator [Pseudomonas sp. 5P_3.1_Bac2]MCU1716117.1 GntR family transcriptional regulator [Pseudomonas sp. 5P_3.1_Bac2]
MQNTQSAEPSSPLQLMPKVERQQLHDTVLEHLRSFITEGILLPGTKLNERQLCETLGVSRTPLREALKVLAVEGLIDISPNRGASVARMSELEICEAFELISGLEAFAGELACERISEQQLADIKALHQAMVASKNQHDLPGYYQRNRAIHDMISLAAGNSVLRHTYLIINRRLQALRYLSNQQSPKWERALHDHEQMLAALEARDGKRLGQILRQHLLDKRDAVLAMLKTAGQ